MATKAEFPFEKGDRVRIREGTFKGYEGDVQGFDEANGRVVMIVNIFGRATPLEAEPSQIEAVEC